MLFNLLHNFLYWAEENNVSANHPKKVKILTEKLELFQKTLPQNPPANTFSNERKILQSER